MVLETVKLRNFLIVILIRQGIASFVNRTKFAVSSHGKVHTSAHSIIIMTLSPSVVAVEKPKVATGTTATPLVETMTATKDIRISLENVSATPHKRGPVEATISISSSQFVNHVNVTMTNTAKTEHSLAHPSITPNTTRDNHSAKKDEDWQVSVIVVNVLLIGMILFVIIVLIRSNHRDELLRNRNCKEKFVTAVPLIRVSADNA